MVYVYFLYLPREDRFYVGYSGDLRRRVSEHKRGAVTATRGRDPSLVYYEAYATDRAARERERVLKGDGRTRRHLTARLKEMLSQDKI